ncbi:hypothetical protein FRB99_001333 [Tulasnella sp. 403]|nr:hypothetical protein FRB99_001333 [Tulasnella sp. 403]
MTVVSMRLRPATRILRTATRPISTAVVSQQARSFTALSSASNLRFKAMPLGVSNNSTDPRRFNSQKAPDAPTWNGPIASYREVKAKSDQPSTTSYLVDVREPDEIAQGSIPSSVAIPLSGFTTSLLLPDIEFEEKHGFKKPGKDEEIIFYCRSGKRSGTAATEARNRGWTNVKSYEGSWLDWVAREQERQKKDFDDD